MCKRLSDVISIIEYVCLFFVCYCQCFKKKVGFWHLTSVSVTLMFKCMSVYHELYVHVCGGQSYCVGITKLSRQIYVISPPPSLQFRRPLSPPLSPPISLYFYLSLSTYLPISSQRFFQYVLMNFIVYALQVTFYSSWCYVPEYAHWSPRLVNCVSVQPGYAYTLFTVKKQKTRAVKPDLCYVDEQGK